MADILIRGMGMPKNCLYCHFVSYDNGHCVVMDKDIPICGTKPSWCPILPLPEGHGRLGDLDALMNNIGDVPYKGSVKRVLMSAPTIVPEEGGGEDG